MRLYIDEDLTPRLAATCHERNYEATCVRDRGSLQAADHAHAEFAFEGNWVFVTNNAGDFLKLAERRGLHPGLIFVPEGSIAQEQAWLEAAIDRIETRSDAEGTSPAAFMTNHVVEVDTDGVCVDYGWPT